jgi:hypothetical protein
VIIQHVDFIIDTGSPITDKTALNMMKEMLKIFNKKLPQGKMRLEFKEEEHK